MGIFTRYKDGRIDVVPHAVLQIFAKFQSQVGKILITAININRPGLAPSIGASLSLVTGLGQTFYAIMTH